MTPYEKLVTDLIDAARSVSAAADTPVHEKLLGKALVRLDDCLYRLDHFEDDPEQTIEQAHYLAQRTAALLEATLRIPQVARSSGDSPGASGGRSGENPASRAMPDNRDRRTPHCARCAPKPGTTT